MPAINKKHLLLKSTGYLFLPCISDIQALSCLHQHGAKK